MTFETDDQLLRDRAILKQRKVSVQLRVSGTLLINTAIPKFRLPDTISEARYACKLCRYPAMLTRTTDVVTFM